MTNPAKGSDSAAADAARHFRQTLGHYPTGVAIITATLEGEPVGMVVGSFTSVSLDPPLVAFFADNGSETWATLRDSGSFCVNVLSSPQEALSRQFVKRGTDRFADVTWRTSPSGSPILDDVVAWIDCDLESVTEYGDHQMVVGRVRDLAANDPVPPLIFHRGGYGEFNQRSLISAPERDLVDALKLVDVSRGILDRLSTDTGLECTVTAAIGANSVVLARIFPEFTEAVGSPVGYRVPLAPPLGPALMAWAPQDELDAWFSRSPVRLTDEAKGQYLALLGRLREDGWAWFTKDTDFQRIQTLLDTAAMEGRPKEAVHREAQQIVGDPGFKFMPEPLEPGADYEMYSFVAPVVLPDRDTVIGVNLIGAGKSFSSEQILVIGEQLRTAAAAVAQLGSLRVAS
jgi:flavin reductase (DIM6/NTAB) family NADH-FMN oxidoreductase RutF/DNA-binding IclR family transcriptional regulator